MYIRAVMYLPTLRQNLNRVLRDSRRCISVSTNKCSTEAVHTESVKSEQWDNAMPYSSIPGPKPIPLLGNTWLFLPIIGPIGPGSFANMLHILYSKYGKIFRLGSIPGPDRVFVTDPKDIEAVFRNEGIYPVRDIGSKTVGYYRKHVRNEIFQGVYGTIPVQGKEWHDFRSQVNPILMHPQTMLQYIEGLNVITDALLAKIRYFAKSDQNNEMPADFVNTIYSWTLESVSFIALDKRLGCLDLNANSEALKIIGTVSEIFELYEKLEFQPTYRNIYKTKKWKRFVEILDFLIFTFLKHIEDAESRIKEIANVEHMSVLQRLLKIDRKVAIAMAMDMLLAGVDTTGKQTASILYYLAKYQDAQDTLRKELCTLLPNKETPITKEVLGQASYLRAVIKETERIAPIGSGNIRETIKDIVFSGYQVPKGTLIVTCNAIASKLKDNYPKPLEFLPERWLRSTTGELSHKNVNPFVTLPFGFGPRSCVGKRIATLEMEIGIAKMIRNFRVMWHHKEPTFQGAPFVGIVDPLKFQFTELES